jgi:hypothetical protein
MKEKMLLPAAEPGWGTVNISVARHKLLLSGIGGSRDSEAFPVKKMGAGP